MKTDNNPLFGTRSFQLDLGRQPEKLVTLKRMVAAAARFGFNQCQLYLENAIKLEAFGPAATGSTKEEIRELIGFAEELGVEIVPSLNLLGHAENFLLHDEFKDMDELRDGARQPWQAWSICFCPSLERTRTWMKEVLDETATIFSSGNVHVGLDETWTLGSCKLCRAREEEIGLGGIFADHASWLNSVVKSQGRKMWMWADMCFYYGNVLDRLPRDIILVDWFYSRVAECPDFSFLNWRKMDSTKEMLDAGFTVVPAGSPSVENVRTFSRYVQGLGIDTFLMTSWEGTLRYPDVQLPEFCEVGNYLATGRMPDWKTAAEQLLPDETDTGRLEFMTAMRNKSHDPEPALTILRKHPDVILFQVKRNDILQSFVRNELREISAEAGFTARQVMRRGSCVATAFAPLLPRLQKALSAADEWQELLERLRPVFDNAKSDRGLYGDADELCAGLRELDKKIEAFCADPVVENFPGLAHALVLDIIPMDPSAHACKIAVGDDLSNLQEVYDVSAMPLANREYAEVVVPLAGSPRYVRVSINGYARVGVASVRCRTPGADLLPKQVIDQGGLVLDAGHLLEWDRKAALFNEPDIAKVWLAHKPVSDNFVLLEF